MNSAYKGVMPEFVCHSSSDFQKPDLFIIERNIIYQQVIFFSCPECKANIKQKYECDQITGISVMCMNGHKMIYKVMFALIYLDSLYCQYPYLYSEIREFFLGGRELHTFSFLVSVCKEMKSRESRGQKFADLAKKIAEQDNFCTRMITGCHILCPLKMRSPINSRQARL